MNVKIKKPKSFKSKPKENDHNILDDQFQETKKWYNEIADDPDKFNRITDEELIALKDEAKKCYDSDCLNYNSKFAKTSSDHRWIKTILSKGTMSDKIAAYTVSIQDNPVYNLENIRNMVNMVKISKKECSQLIEVLSELFLDNLLHPKRKLKQFQQRPLSLLNKLSSGNAITRRKYLCYWYFEDQLKETYTTFILALNKVAHDTIDANKEKALSAMYKLLAGNSEQEKNLLPYIVNKLGDPSQKVASKAIYCLTQLLRQHLNMQVVVLLEVEKLLFRTNISKRAQYYSLCFLSQYYLSHEESDVAKKLITVYFSFFKACIKQGDVDSRMMSALLIGVNRAYPYAKLELEKVNEHVDAMYKIVHLANFNVALNALSLLYQVSDYSNSINDRFYSALYRKLLDPDVCQTAHQAILLNLIYKALRKDTEKNRVKVFIKRLLQVVMYMIPSLACGILYLISKLISESPDLNAFEIKFSILNDDEDDNEEEKYLDVIDQKEEKNHTKALEEEQASEKGPKEDDESKNDDVETKPENEQNKPKGSWVHQGNPSNKIRKRNCYDGLNRNPLFAGGEFCSYVELPLLTNHFHPTVSLYATQILNGERIKYNGDPLKDFTLMRFLDRFVFKNPKKMEDIERKGCHPTFGKRDAYLPKGIKSISINSESYLNQNQNNVPVDERFLLLYFQKRKIQTVKSEDDEESDLESVGSDEFNEMLDKMSEFKGADDDLDYLNDIGENMKKKTKKTKDEDEEDVLDDDELSAEDDDDVNIDEDQEHNDDDENFDEMDDEDRELIEGLSDDDASDLEFDTDDESDKNVKRGKTLNTKGIRDDIKNILASAEEFASVLEDEGTSKLAPGSAQALANKDNAATKQLAWEEKRNRWVKGFDKFVGSKRKKQGGKYGKNKKTKK